MSALPSFPVDARRSSVDAAALPPLADLEEIDVTAVKASAAPVKCIFVEEDVSYWLKSHAHHQYMLFLARVARACVGKSTVVPYARDPDTLSQPVRSVLQLLNQLDGWTKEIKPFDSPQRFGNLAFRNWGERFDSQLAALHEQLLPPSHHAIIPELSGYLAGAFGSFVRLDYGSGHELAFAAWLCFLRRTSFLTAEDEEAIGLRIIPMYLQTAFNLQDTYKLEPAGSHGVWGLDDYHFIPYILGAAQLSAQKDYKPSQISSSTHRPAGGLQQQHVPPAALLSFVPSSTAGTSGGAGRPPPLRSVDPSMPLPASLTATSRITGVVETPPPFCNLFTSSIARIHSLKRGPFAEHSPLLNDLAGSVPNWVKMFNGMLKMYDAECLAKRPVVQHFPFGEVCFRWERPIRAAPPEEAQATAAASVRAVRGQGQSPTAAPWAQQPASRAQPPSFRPLPPPTSARAADANARGSAIAPTMAPTAAPWARAGPPGSDARSALSSSGSAAALSSPFGALPRPFNDVAPKSQPERRSAHRSAPYHGRSMM